MDLASHEKLQNLHFTYKNFVNNFLINNAKGKVNDLDFFENQS